MKVAFRVQVNGRKEIMVNNGAENEKRADHMLQIPNVLQANDLRPNTPGTIGHSRAQVGTGGHSVAQVGTAWHNWAELGRTGQKLTASVSAGSI